MTKSTGQTDHLLQSWAAELALMDPEGRVKGGLLAGNLAVAVPLWIERYAGMNWEEGHRRALICMQVVAERGDLILYRSTQTGETAEAFNRLAEGLAILARQPGGVTFAGQHWEAPRLRTLAEIVAGVEAGVEPERAPRRIRLRRTTGWRKPLAAAVVARPTRWGNPFTVLAMYAEWVVLDRATERGRCSSRAEAVALAVELYAEALAAGTLAFTVDDVRRELAGRDLACWCPILDAEGVPAPCHADVLLEIANAPR